MRRATPARLVILSAAVCALLLCVTPTSRSVTEALPQRLDDRAFWTLVTEFSEPSGTFRSDNLVSNEDTFQYVIPALRNIVKPGGVYLGVGPDQNFTYIAALRPRMAFILDVRRGNLHAHLLYKALFELAETRVDFLARLFSKARPRDLTPAAAGKATAEQLFDAFAMVTAERATYDQHLIGVLDHLRRVRGFPIDDQDAIGIAYVYSAFFSAGPFLTYASGAMTGRGRYPAYQDLQMADDGTGKQWAYLASEANYRAVRDMQRSNLIVPVVGNFGGDKALRAIGAWVKARGALVTTFYTSNVEQYLFNDRVWDNFARNLAALPVDASSTLLRTCFGMCGAPPGSRSVTLLDSLPLLVRDFDAGRINGYYDVLSRTR